MATWRQTLSSNQYYEVILNVSQTSQSIANNTSNISWNLQVRKSYGSGFWGADSTASTWSVAIDGTNVSNSSGSYDFRGGAPLTKTIASGTRTITHNGDGSKSVAVSGYWKDNANGLGSGNPTGTFTLSTIPRASELTAFSFASHLKNHTANTINYTVSRKSGSFRHQIQLRDGSTTVLQWDNVSSDGASTQTLTASEVNTLLTRMPSSTSKTFTLRIATRSGVNGGFIGSAVTRTATGTVHADVKPNVTGLSFSINGSRIDKTVNKYVQGYTKVNASHTSTAGYSSSIKENKITVQRTDGSDSQVINGHSGTTSKPLSRSGTYRVVHTATDNRGRSTTATSANFTVQAYSPPSITSFTLSRGTTTPTEVTIVANGTFSSIGGSNTATLNIQRRSSAPWADVGNNNTSTNGSISRTAVSTGNLIISSYEFKVKVTDLFGGVAEAIDTVSTQQVVMDIYRNQGVAFGKMYEPSKGGALQIGTALNGGLFLGGHASTRPLRVRGIEGHAGGGTTNDNADADLYLNWNGKKDVYAGGNLQVNGKWTIGHGVVESGSNENGDFMRFESGLQIRGSGYVGVQMTAGTTYGNLLVSGAVEWVFPAGFSLIPALIVGVRRISGGGAWGVHTGGLSTTSASAIRIAGTQNNTVGVLQPIAIGWWK